MKKLKAAFFILFCVNICGCSIPSSARYSELYSFTKEEKKIKGAIGSKRKAVIITDFRQNEMYEEDITALKEEVEKYIAAHADLSESTKNNLRELKVTEGETLEEVKLLLGEPDKVGKSGASETWIYRINRWRVFSFFILPVFPAHEGYYLRFKNNLLTAIERHYPRQTIHQASGPGILGIKKQ